MWDKLPYVFRSMTFGILLLAHQHFQKWCHQQGVVLHWLRLPTNPNWEHFPAPINFQHDAFEPVPNKPAGSWFIHHDQTRVVSRLGTKLYPRIILEEKNMILKRSHIDMSNIFHAYMSAWITYGYPGAVSKYGYKQAGCGWVRFRPIFGGYFPIRLLLQLG